MVRFQTVQDEPKLVAQVAAALKASNVEPGEEGRCRCCIDRAGTAVVIVGCPENPTVAGGGR